MKRLICLLLVLLLGLSGCVEAPPEPTTAPPRQTEAVPEATVPETTAPALQAAPDFTVYDQAGNPVKLSDFKGKPVVLNFWASWCGPCKAEMPDFDETFKKLEGQVEFVMVNLTDGTGETVESAASFIAQAGYSFPVYYDTGMEAAAAYGIQSIPTTFFIDAAGNLVAYYPGTMPAATLAKGIALIHPVTE